MAPARKISIGSPAGDPLVTGTNVSAVLSVPSALWYQTLLRVRVSMTCRLASELRDPFVARKGG
jgi:hypothetical protein